MERDRDEHNNQSCSPLMLAARGCCSVARKCAFRATLTSHRPSSNNVALKPTVETDSHAIPTRPTWSVNELLSSYPKPKISPATLKHLHELSALIPPEEGTPEHAKLTAEMENLVKLVEAVKLVDVGESSVSESGEVPDGRIWAAGTGIRLEREKGGDSAADDKEVHGQALLGYAARTENKHYVVDTDRKR